MIEADENKVVDILCMYFCAQPDRVQVDTYEALSIYCLLRVRQSGMLYLPGARCSHGGWLGDSVLRSAGS